MPYSVALTLPEGHKVSGKQKLLGSYSYLISMTCNVEAIKVEHPDTTLALDFINQRN